MNKFGDDCRVLIVGFFKMYQLLMTSLSLHSFCQLLAEKPTQISLFMLLTQAYLVYSTFSHEGFSVKYQQNIWYYKMFRVIDITAEDSMDTSRLSFVFTNYPKPVLLNFFMNRYTWVVLWEG